MRLLTALLTVLTLAGLAGAASAQCPWMKGNATQSTADGNEKVVLPGQTS